MGRPAANIAWILLVLPLSAQNKGTLRPNFSGTWELNLKRSGPILPRGTEALTMVIDHHDPLIQTSETRRVAGQTTQGAGETARIDGQMHVAHPEPGKTVESMQGWSGSVLVM